MRKKGKLSLGNFEAFCMDPGITKLAKNTVIKTDFVTLVTDNIFYIKDTHRLKSV